MNLDSALDAMQKHKDALLDEGASNPSVISENTHRLAQYIGVAEDRLAELEYDLEINEATKFQEFIKEGKSVNAAKESSKRHYIKERALIAKTTRLTTSGWKLVSESQSRVKHLIAEANNQI